ncbi:MAG: YHS domain-containing protein [Chloroflexi bacterium]|nr:YHS domain-containing protein [Chloroflexota bacterium]
MKALFFVIVFFVLLSSLIWSSACLPPSEKLQGVTPGVISVSLPTVDPVCGVELDALGARAAGLTSEWKANPYYFCSRDCKEKFDRAPMMYHAKCPVCNATVQKTAALAGDHGGRAYFFDAPEHRAAFLKEPANYLGGLVIDVVCGMEVVRAKAEESGLTVEHSGQTFYFCGPGCKDKFLKDPAQFTGEQAAVCPVCGMGVVKNDARAGGLTSVYQANSYYFCCTACQQYFDRNPEKYLR